MALLLSPGSSVFCRSCFPPTSTEYGNQPIDTIGEIMETFFENANAESYAIFCANQKQAAELYGRL